MSILVTQNFINKAKEENLQNLSYQVEDVVTFFDESFQEYKNKGVVLFSNQQLANKSAFLGSGIEALNLLRSFQTFNSEDKICIYYDGGKIYYSAGLAGQFTFYKKTLGCTDYSVQKAIEIMESNQYECCILNVGQSSGYLMYHIPVGKDVTGSARSMQAFISFNSLEEVLRNMLPNEYTLLQICVNGDSCYFYNNGQEMNAVSLNEFEELTGNCEEIPLQSSSTELSLTVTVWNDIDNQLKEFYYLRNTNIFILTAGILISIIVAFGLSVARFSQIKALVNQVLNGNDNSEKKHVNYGNEFDYIKLVLNESLKNSVRKNSHTYRRIMLEQVSTLIVHGIITEKEEMDAALKVCGTELLEEYYYFCGIEIEEKTQIEQLEELLQWDIHYVIRDKNYVFILCELHNWDFDLTVRRKVVQKLVGFLKEAGISCRQVALSQVYNQLSFANRSYLQVYSILESQSEEKGQMVFWEEWIQKHEGNNNLFGMEYLNEFRKAVSLKDITHAEKALRKLFQQSKEKKSKDDKCYEHFMVLQALSSEIRKLNNEELNQKLQMKIASLDLENERLFEKEVSQILIEYFKEKEADTGEFSEIRRFIDENYTRYDLSLEMIAEHIGVSKSAISKLFKNETGINYIDYVSRLRMNKAKELLENTDMNIKEIFLTVGYMDNVTAGRKFKAYFKISPAAYRAQIQNGKEEK